MRDSLNDEKYTYTGTIIQDRPKAVLVFFDDEGEIWIPKSQMEVVTTRGNETVFMIPRWLAKEKGLVV